MLICQSVLNPGRVRNAIADSLAPELQSLAVACAYVTEDGSKLLIDACIRAIGRDRWNAIPKSLTTCFDYGITTPTALRLWAGLPNSTVRVAGADLVKNNRLARPAFSYHPKVYAFAYPDDTTSILVGSANLTGRALSSNTEAVWMQSAPTASAQEQLGSLLVLSDALIDSYATARAQLPAPNWAESAPVARDPVGPQPHALPVLAAQVAAGAIDPSAFDEMWVEVHRLQGGSGNQLELPRGAHRFFGMNFNQYGATDAVLIGVPFLVSGASKWRDRRLTWHGNNRMERLNLPTLHQGGFNYEESVVMFRRVDNAEFELVVVPLRSDLATAWLNASERLGAVFRLGENTDRLVGFGSRRA